MLDLNVMQFMLVIPGMLLCGEAPLFTDVKAHFVLSLGVTKSGEPSYTMMREDVEDLSELS